MVNSSPLILKVNKLPLSERFSILVFRHEPEMALAPAGPFATRVASPLPVTGAPLVLLLSLNSKVSVLPSGETVEVEVMTTLPFFLSVSSIWWSFTTLIATES